MRKEIFRIFLMSAAVYFCMLFGVGAARAQQCGLPGLPPCPSKPTTTKKTAPKPTTQKPQPAPSKPAVKSKPQQPRFVPRAPEIEMVEIPAGSFMMGSDNGVADEKPVHRVNISYNFYMGKYEVTQAQWRAVMGNNPSDFKGCDNCPVDSVSWDDAQEFIRKLNSLQNEYEYRLPTEAEWEYACRAGTTGDYAGNLDLMAWYSANSGGKTHPVGQKQPNDWGLYDMHGNVWEWVQDWHRSYPNGTVIDPTGASSGSFRVNRGGGCYSSADYLRSALRSSVTPSYRYNRLGFRLVRH